MNKTAEYLDKCKEKLNISSTYALAKEWEVGENLLHNYYTGKSHPDEFMCFRIAEVLEIDPAYVIAQIKSESEKNEKKRDYFRSFGGTSRKIAASIMLAVALSTTLLSALPHGSVFNAFWRVFSKRRTSYNG